MNGNSDGNSDAKPVSETLPTPEKPEWCMDLCFASVAKHLAPQEQSVKLLDVIDVCTKQGAFVFFLLVVNVQCNNANESSIPLPTLSCHMYFLSFSFVLWVLAVAKWLLWSIIYLGSNFHLRFLLLPLPFCDLGSGRLI